MTPKWWDEEEDHAFDNEHDRTMHVGNVIVGVMCIVMILTMIIFSCLR